MNERENLIKVVRGLVIRQAFAVLATQSDTGPYCTLVAFAVTDDLAAVLFATKRETAKYANARASRAVSLLIDDRPPDASDIGKARAVTVLGAVMEANGEEKSLLGSVYINKHPGLADFVAGKDTALMKISVERYIIAGFNGASTLKMT